jgi:hypothetical protein
LTYFWKCGNVTLEKIVWFLSQNKISLPSV